MSRILKNVSASDPVERFGSTVWHIAGERWSNSAVKFWSAIIDEILQDYPGVSKFVFSTFGEITYRRRHLFPEISISKSHFEAQHLDLADIFKNTLNEIEVFGLPQPVHVSLIKDDSEFLACNLPLDCIDSETAPYLLVWLFEWCEIHESHWNNSAFSGKFQAFDRARMVVYELSCSLQKTDLSEGLYKLELELGFTREESG